MKNSHKALLLATSLFALFGATAASATSVVVTSTNSGGWTFSNADNFPNTNASGGFVSGPSAPPLGTGSAQLSVGDASSSEVLYQILQPTPVGQLSTLSYYSYVSNSTPGSGSAPTLQFDLYQGASYEGRLVFDPGLLLSTTQNVWQSWDASTADAWYFTHAGLGTCSISGSYCTLSQAQAFLTPLGIDFTDVLFKAGSGQASFLGSVDDFTFNDSIYDFEADVPEPVTLSLFGAGLTGAILLRRRKRTPKA